MSGYHVGSYVLQLLSQKIVSKVGSQSSLIRLFIEYSAAAYPVPGPVLEAHMGETDTQGYTIQYNMHLN